jgi:hypothetical protein
VIQNHSHRAGAHLGRELVGRLACHGSTFSGVEASDKPGAVQCGPLGSPLARPVWISRTTSLNGDYALCCPTTFRFELADDCLSAFERASG